MRAREAMVAWNPGRVEVAEGDAPAGTCFVMEWPDHDRRSRPWWYWRKLDKLSDGSFGNAQPGSSYGVFAAILVNFHTLVVRDGVDLQVAHREFLKVDEYRDFISPDCDGATQPGQETTLPRLKVAR